MSRFSFTELQNRSGVVLHFRMMLQAPPEVDISPLPSYSRKVEGLDAHGEA